MVEGWREKEANWQPSSPYSLGITAPLTGEESFLLSQSWLLLNCSLCDGWLLLDCGVQENSQRENRGRGPLKLLQVFRVPFSEPNLESFSWISVCSHQCPLPGSRLHWVQAQGYQRGKKMVNIARLVVLWILMFFLNPSATILPLESSGQCCIHSVQSL